MQDINTNSVKVPELDFSSPFVLEARSDQPTQMRAFLTWFDTFFSPDASSSGQAPANQETDYIKYDDSAYTRPVPLQSNTTTHQVSFTTGPRGKPTHWKQVAFLLQEPVMIPPRHRIQGEFKCRKSRSGNTRELDVEIHWKVLGGGVEDSSAVQRYNVFRVC